MDIIIYNDDYERENIINQQKLLGKRLIVDSIDKKPVKTIVKKEVIFPIFNEKGELIGEEKKLMDVEHIDYITEKSLVFEDIENTVGIKELLKILIDKKIISKDDLKKI